MHMHVEVLPGWISCYLPWTMLDMVKYRAVSFKKDQKASLYFTLYYTVHERLLERLFFTRKDVGIEHFMAHIDMKSFQTNLFLLILFLALLVAFWLFSSYVCYVTTLMKTIFRGTWTELLCGTVCCSRHRTILT